MARKVSFVCRGENNHILVYDIPDGITIESFAENTACRECRVRIDWSEEFNHNI